MPSNAAENEEPVPDVELLMRKIRQRVKESAEKGPASAVRHVNGSAGDGASQSPVLYSEELNYLNAHWHDWHSISEPASHRKFLGKFILRAKRFVIDTVWTSLMRDYIDREKQFQVNLIRFLNSTARYIDARDKEIFWQLVKKVDHDIEGNHERTDYLINELDGTLRTIERGLSGRISAGESRLDEQAAKWTQLGADVTKLDDLIRGLERTLAVLARPAGQSVAQSSGAPAGTQTFSPDGVDYLLLENRFRGSEELIRERLRSYLETFRGLPGPVLDIGCGRGEFLDLLREEKIDGKGIDLDPAMVARSQEKGLDVTENEALRYLRSIPEKSLGGIFASQVVEHLKKELEELATLAASRVAPGGVVVFETINPQSVVALARNFFRDPTHVWPIHPDTLRFVMEMKGLETLEVRYLSPYPPAAMLQPLEVSPYLPARWQGMIGSINSNITRLNDLLFGHQDFCVIAKVPQR